MANDHGTLSGEHRGQYDHLNSEPLSVTVDMDALAELVVAQNYGFVRMLSAMVRVMRRRQAADVQRYRERGDHDIAEFNKGDHPLTDAIERGINERQWR